MPKEITTYNGLCPCCGKDAYLGFSSVECSNRECENFDGEEEKKEEEPLLVPKVPTPLKGSPSEELKIIDVLGRYHVYKSGLFMGYLQK